MTLNEFFFKHIGKKVDWDKAYGAQCVDLYRQYTHDVTKLPQTPAVSGAKEIFYKHGQYRQVFKDFKQGDVLVWDGTDGNPYGHVAVLMAICQDGSLVVFEQDGYAQDGAKLMLRSKDNLLGGLRV